MWKSVESSLTVFSLCLEEFACHFHEKISDVLILYHKINNHQLTALEKANIQS